MKKYILFSAVSGTDPIARNSDGPLLHICRKYKPAVIYLYLSKEMLELHRRDDRYCRSLNRLGETLGYTFKIEIIERPDLDNPHVFDIFYHEFRSILSEISDKYKGEDFELLLNVSSGTPAMDAALQTLAAFSDSKYRPIQVPSPANGGNFNKEFDFEERWVTNKDNQENFNDRCVVSEHLNLAEEIRYGIIRGHLEVYDYTAANNVAKNCNHLSKISLAMLEASEKRFRLELDEVWALQKQYEFNFMPRLDTVYQMNIEYLLTLDIKRKRKEYVDFIRGVTPIIIDVLESYLSNILDIRIKDYCEKSKSGKVYITRKKLGQTKKGRDILEKLENGFSIGSGKGYNENLPYSSVHLKILIESYGSDKNVFSMVKELRRVEQNVRNFAAHVIICLTEDIITKECGKSPADIMETLWKLARKAGIYQNESIQSSYDNMNELIINQLYSGTENSL
ncbi:type III-A CRISPR-associated CARF protein Csm6 [Diplocloster hominis]|uniref:type III-A CRISPR-associated CARF protein Csm6 n=1 Tax=Diplocloster hominis TaxID=3079010 RepID=UPI0031BA26F3